MALKPLSIEGAWVHTPEILSDSRGLFFESFKESELRHSDIPFQVKQTNVSVSKLGVIRGIHWADSPPGQAKFVSCHMGSIIDVVVDLRAGSVTFGNWDSRLLNSSNRESVLIESGLGHAFIALEDNTLVSYLCSEEYSPTTERSINPLDKTIDIDWAMLGGKTSFSMSERDRNAPSLKELLKLGLLPTL